MLKTIITVINDKWLMINRNLSVDSKFNMLILTTLFAIHVGLVGSMVVAPVNITVTFISPTSVRVSWHISKVSTSAPVEKYEVTYKPTEARTAVEVITKLDAVELDGLIPDTQYQVTVAAIQQGRRHFSRPIVFRTYSDIDDFSAMSAKNNPNPTINDINFNIGLQTTDNGNQSSNLTARELPMIRGVEVGIVLVVLIVWAGAIALFFNRWGKIRMLLPYQPTYKQEQSFKVPGTTACAPGACIGPHSHTQTAQHVSIEEPLNLIPDRTQRSRKNSAVFVSTEGKGFDAVEFSRRYGSQSVLCRKTKSADSIPINDQNRRFSENKIWETEENQTPPQTDSIEMVECYNDPQRNQQQQQQQLQQQQQQKTPKLNTLPTLSISVPSPSPPYEDEEKFL